MKDYKVNQKVWHIEINNAIDEKSYRPNGVKIEELKVIGISKFKVCLNNDWFTSFDLVQEGRRKDNYRTYLDDVSVGIRTGNSILGDGVFISLHSTKKPTKRTLNKMVAATSVKIDKEYGFLFSGVKDTLYDFVENFEMK